MNFKDFFNSKRGPHHHSMKRLTSIGDGGIHKDGKIKSLGMVAAMHKKKKDPKIEAAKKGQRRWISNSEALKHAKDHGFKLENLTSKGLRLNSAHSATLYYCPIRKQYYLE